MISKASITFKRYCKRDNMKREGYQRDFFEDIINSRFNVGEYWINNTVGLGVDYMIPESDTALELKNINHNSKPLGKGFIQKEVTDRFEIEDFNNKLLVASCSNITKAGIEELERREVHYCILPFQTLPTMSFKQWIKNKKILIGFLADYLPYHNPYRKKPKLWSSRKTESISINTDNTYPHTYPQLVDVFTSRNTCFNLNARYILLGKIDVSKNVFTQSRLKQCVDTLDVSINKIKQDEDMLNVNT